MKYDQLKKNRGEQVRIRPMALRSDGFSELPPEDDYWIIQQVAREGVQISNTRTGHVTTLGLDHIQSYCSDPDKSVGGLTRGFLNLHVQISLRGNSLDIEPITKQGLHR